MGTMRPFVSIGLPVYNGEDYIAGAIESVLNQTYTEIELIVSDNGSVDATESISQEYASRDERVRYYRSDRNRGASWNYNRTVELAKGRYFRWLAHDDMLASTLIEKSVSILQQHPEVLLCFTWTKDIDNSGQEIAVKQSTRKYADSSPSIRFFSLSLVLHEHNCEEVFGLMRTSDLRQTPMIANYTDSDRTLLGRLALRGVFYEIPEPLFLHRLHEQSSVKVYSDDILRMIWFDPAKQGKLAFPSWHQISDLFLASTTAPVSFSEHLKCFIAWARLAKRRRQALFAEARQGGSYFFSKLAKDATRISDGRTGPKSL